MLISEGGGSVCMCVRGWGGLGGYVCVCLCVYGGGVGWAVMCVCVCVCTGVGWAVWFMEISNLVLIELAS